MHCQETKKDETSIHNQDKILLMGNPNVGKSVVFSKLTGVNVISSNFAGTTVTYTEGTVKIKNKEYKIIDVPGTYALDATSEAEEVATKFMKNGASAVICVLDATNLERNLKLALDILTYDIPVIFALNLMDVAKRHGTEINVGLLAQELGSPVIPTVAVKGEGLEEITKRLDIILNPIQVELAGCEGKCAGCKGSCGNVKNENSWERAAEITRRVRKETTAAPSFLDRLGEKMIRPWPGIPIAIAIMAIALGFIVTGGKFLEEQVLGPLVEVTFIPFFANIISSFTEPGVLQNILIGEYGIFVIGFEWILALILPYVTLFYVVFSFLEDSGYLPRLGILFDGIMSKLGVQGGSLISIMMGYGCAVPAIISTRAATTKKERLMITSIVCFAIPCISQTGALISLFASESYWLLLGAMLVGIVVIAIVSIITNKLIPGKVDPLIIEVPNLLIPERSAYFKKLWIRMKHFLVEAEGPMLVAIIIAAVFKESGMLESLSQVLAPFVEGWLGLPKEAVMGLILGIVRREMAAAPLLALDLNALQVFVGGVVALLYLPCISVFAILAKEFNAKIAVAIAVATTATAFLVGGIINHIGLWIMQLL